MADPLTDQKSLVQALRELAEDLEFSSASPEDRQLIVSTADLLAGPMAYHVHQEVNEAHLALDRLGAPKTRLVPNRSGDGKQEITLGLKDRIRSLGERRTPPEEALNG